MIDPVTGWFEIKQYDNKWVISIATLVETMWLARDIRPVETMYDQESEFIGHELINFPNWNIIRYINQDKHIGESNFQFYIGTDSPGYR